MAGAGAGFVGALGHLRERLAGELARVAELREALRDRDGIGAARAIHERDHVGRELIRALDGNGSILGLANDFEVVLQLKKASQATTDDLVVINYQDLDAS